MEKNSYFVAFSSFPYRVTMGFAKVGVQVKRNVIVRIIKSFVKRRRDLKSALFVVLLPSVVNQK